MQKSESVLIKDILAKALPNESELLGDEVLDQVIAQRGSTAPTVQLPGGHDFNLSAVLELVKVAAQLAATLIPLYIQLKKSGKQPSGADLLSAAPEQAGGLNEADKLRIAQEVAAAGES